MTVTPNSMVRLLSVPFFNDYKHTMDFATKADQTTYMLSKVNHSYDKFTYQRQERTLKIPANIDSILDCNYVMYQNVNYNTKWFYAFIISKRYVNPNMTELTLETDVFQTWQFDLTPKLSFIERKHLDRWNADGSPIINTTDEGLNYGTEYDNVSVDNWQPNEGSKWLVIAAKGPLETPSVPAPSVIGTPQPLTYYISPFKDDDTVPGVNGVGAGILVSKPSQILNAMYNMTGAQDNIVSIYVTDHTGIETTTNASDGSITFPANGDSITAVQFTGGGDTVNVLKVDKVLNFKPLIHSLGDKWTGFETVTESKLLMYPYCLTILDDFKGNRVTLKNEFINSDTLDITCKGSLGISNKVSYSVTDYNFLANGMEQTISDEHGLINTDPNDIPIITNLLAAYIQGNKNTLYQQKNQIYYNAIEQTVQAAGSGALTGALAGGGVGAAIGGIGAGIAGGVTSGISAFQQIQAINAKQKDIGATPPQISRMGGNSSYTLGNGYDGIYVIKKQIKLEYRNKLTDFFKAFGYRINKYQTPEWTSREHFNYIKTVGVNLQGNIPGEDMNVLRAIFDNGVTIWHVDDVGNYTLENAEV